jgi:hypothetical protein
MRSSGAQGKPASRALLAYPNARQGKLIIAGPPLAPAGFNCIRALDRPPNCPSISPHWLFDSSARRDSFAVSVTARASRSHRVCARPRSKRTAASLSVKATAHSSWSLNSFTLHARHPSPARSFHTSYNLDLSSLAIDVPFRVQCVFVVAEFHHTTSSSVRTIAGLSLSFITTLTDT